MNSFILPAGLPQWVLLIVLLIIFAWRTLAAAADYKRLQALDETRDRQKILASWTIEGVVLFGFGSFVILALINRVPTFFGFPEEFLRLFALANATEEFKMLPWIFSASLLLGSIIGSFTRRNESPIERHGTPPQVKFDALLPRNNAERVWSFLLSFSAGITEEMMFRLALPLLLTMLIGNVWVAFALSIFIFGLMHLYQGWGGVLATSFVALIFTIIYVMYGGLLLPIIVHTLIDLNALLLGPWIASWRLSKSTD